MKTILTVLSYLGKVLGLVTALNTIPGVSPGTGAIIFFCASLLETTINRVGDFLDNGKEDKSWQV